LGLSSLTAVGVPVWERKYETDCILVNIARDSSLPLTSHIHVCVSHSLFLSLSLSHLSALSVVPLSISFSLCFSVSVSVSVCVSLSLLSVYLSVPLSLCLSVCLSVYVSVCLCLCVCVSMCLSVCVSVCLCFGVFVCRCVGVSVSVCPCVRVSVFLCVCVSVRLCVYLSPARLFCPSPLSLSPTLSPACCLSAGVGRNRVAFRWEAQRSAAAA